MRVLLIGEFSRLHNSLKEGLLALGHTVILVSNGDDFKNYPMDWSTKPIFFETKFGAFLRKVFFKITEFDLSQLEIAVRFYGHLKKMNGFDVVQLINEAAIQTTPLFERYFLKQIIKHNKKLFLLCCGVDYNVMNHMIQKKERYSILNQYFENKNSISEFDFMFDFISKNHKKTHDLIYQNCTGIIASDLDYVNPIKNYSRYLGMISNPINIEKIHYIENLIQDKIIIFLGINRNTYHSKGIVFFEKALEIIKHNYPNKIEIIITENIAYNDYVKKYNMAHILLDQVYSFDQGYNALEAMGKGKVVFTGAEKEFESYYNLTETVAINALPDTDYLVEKLSFLIENPNEIVAIGKRARFFIEQEHDYLKSAEKYIDVWG